MALQDWIRSDVAASVAKSSTLGGYVKPEVAAQSGFYSSGTGSYGTLGASGSGGSYYGSTSTGTTIQVPRYQVEKISSKETLPPEMFKARLEISEGKYFGGREDLKRQILGETDKRLVFLKGRNVAVQRLNEQSVSLQSEYSDLNESVEEFNARVEARNAAGGFSSEEIVAIQAEQGRLKSRQQQVEAQAKDFEVKKVRLEQQEKAAELARQSLDREYQNARANYIFNLPRTSERLGLGIDTIKPDVYTGAEFRKPVDYPIIKTNYTDEGIPTSGSVSIVTPDDLALAMGLPSIAKAGVQLTAKGVSKVTGLKQLGKADVKLFEERGFWGSGDEFFIRGTGVRTTAQTSKVRKFFNLKPIIKTEKFDYGFDVALKTPKAKPFAEIKSLGTTEKPFTEIRLAQSEGVSLGKLPDELRGAPYGDSSKPIIIGEEIFSRETLPEFGKSLKDKLSGISGLKSESIFDVRGFVNVRGSRVLLKDVQGVLPSEEAFSNVSLSGFSKSGAKLRGVGEVDDSFFVLRSEGVGGEGSFYQKGLSGKDKFEVFGTSFETPKTSVLSQEIGKPANRFRIFGKKAEIKKFKVVDPIKVDKNLRELSKMYKEEAVSKASKSNSLLQPLTKLETSKVLIGQKLSVAPSLTKKINDVYGLTVATKPINVPRIGFGSFEQQDEYIYSYASKDFKSYAGLKGEQALKVIPFTSQKISAGQKIDFKSLTLPKVKQVSNFGVRQNESFGLKNLEAVLPKVVAKESVKINQAQRIATATKLKSLTAVKAKTLTRTIPKTVFKPVKPFKPIMPTPKPPVMFPPYEPPKFKEVSSFTKGFDVYVRKGVKVGGKTVYKETSLAKNVSKELGILIGSKRVKATSERSFYLKPSGYAAKFVPVKLDLKEFRATKGKSKLKKESFVELSKYAIDAPQEKLEIPYAAKKKKKKSKKLLWF